MMKILMIAPEPFFEPRGTPFSEYYRIKALCAMGHEVDLVTYPIGEDKDIEGLRIFRCFRPWWIKGIKTGPSAAKLVLDFFLFFKAWGRMIFGKYDMIHTHEEANIMGAFFSFFSRVPHLYDMHSSLVQQMDNFKFTKSKLIVGFFKLIEKISLRNAKSVIVICKSLFEYSGQITEPEKLTIIENFIDETTHADQMDMEKVKRIRSDLGADHHKVVMYTGTLETYQGIPMLMESMIHLPEEFKLALIGGKPEQVEAIKQKAQEMGLGERMVLTGRKPAGDIPYYLKAADILASPRILGTNIPLKIYSYLKSGIPVVATNLYTHTQTLTADISILTEPEAEAFAEGIKDAAGEKGQTIARQAAEFCAEHYTYERYVELVKTSLEKAVPGQGE